MFARHKIIWATNDGWEQLRAGADAADLEILDRWREADWPLIIRRRDEDARPEEICVGIALPPDPVNGKKKRIGLRVTREAVREVRQPLAIGEVLKAAPEWWRPGLESLAERTRELGLNFRVYGSLALQAMTGQAYITPRSDIDLLFLPLSVAQLGTGTGLLSYYANSLPLDGEIVFPAGRGVSWKEWTRAVHASSNLRVLTKDAHEVSLMSTSALLEAFDKKVREVAA